MANYNRSEAYQLSYSIPAIKIPEPQIERPQAQPGRKQNGGRAAVKVSKKTLGTALRTARIFTAAAVLLVLFAGILLTRINIESLDKEATRIQSLINDANSENTRLRNQLSSTVSKEKVEAYATGVLGMHKLERYQIHYFEEKAADEVVIVNGKAPAEKSEKR